MSIDPFAGIDMNQLMQSMQMMGIGRPPAAPATGLSQAAPNPTTEAKPAANPAANPLSGNVAAQLAPLIPPAPVEDPKVKYANQLAKMKEMGFINEEVNLDALKATHGIIDAAIERIITMMK